MQKIDGKEFLKIWRKIANLEQLSERELCGVLGISPLTATYWRTGKTKTVRPRHLRAIKDKLGYTIEARQDGTLSMEVSQQDRARITKMRHPAGKEERVNEERDVFLAPLVADLFSAARPGSRSGGLWYSPFQSSDLAHSFWYRAEDDLMGPMFLKGDYLLLTKRQDQLTSGLALVIARGEKKPFVCRIGKNAGKAELMKISGTQWEEPFD